jgi:outer membrane protein insertion porin family
MSQALIDADVQRLKDAYRRAGYGLASVSGRIAPLPNGRSDVVFTIVESGKTGIKSINFSGNGVYSSGRLRDLMTSTESNFLSFIKTSDVYEADRITSDLELIRRFYLKNGYADFQIVSNNARFDEAQGGWVIDIAVDEGPQYRVGNVAVDSKLPDVDPNALQRVVATSAGDTYNAEAVEKSLLALTTEVSRRGYAFAQVRPRGDRDAAGRQIGITYVVDEGPRVYVERINVRGNTRTRDYVVRRELDLGEGDAYNKVLVDRAERRLNNLGFFSKVRITNEPGSTPDRVVVNIDVEDKATGSFSIAAVTRPRTASSAKSRCRNRTSLAAASSSASPVRSASAPRASISPSPSRTSSAIGSRRASTCSRSTTTTTTRPFRKPRDRRAGALDLPDHGRVLDHAALFALYDRDQDSEHRRTSL